MHIEFIAHATFYITLDDGRRIVIDPYCSHTFSGRFEYPPFETLCDFAAITHEHIDHNYTKDLRGNPVIVRTGWHDSRLNIRSVFCWHDKFQGTKFGGGVQMKIIEADGTRLCHMGDCGEILSKAQIDNIGEVDILIIPVGGFYTINGDEAFALAERMHAKTIIPCHYASPLCTLPIEDVSRFLSHYPHWHTMSGSVSAECLPDGVLHLLSRFGGQDTASNRVQP